MLAFAANRMGKRGLKFKLFEAGIEVLLIEQMLIPFNFRIVR